MTDEPIVVGAVWDCDACGRTQRGAVEFRIGTYRDVCRPCYAASNASKGVIYSGMYRNGYQDIEHVAQVAALKAGARPWDASIEAQKEVDTP